MIHTYKGKELHGENGWYDAFDLCCIIGFRSPKDTIRRYVAKEDQRVVGLDTYVNENGLWSLVFAPSVKANTKRDVSKWLRGVLECSGEDARTRKDSNYDDNHIGVENEKLSVKVEVESNKCVCITITMK